MLTGTSSHSDSGRDDRTEPSNADKAPSGTEALSFVTHSQGGRKRTYQLVKMKM